MIRECSQHYTKRNKGPRSQLSELQTVFKEIEPCRATTKEGLTVGTFLTMLLLLAAQSCPSLCNPTDCSPPGTPIHGILQARTLEWVAISLSKRICRKKESEVAQSCPTLCDPMDCSLPGSSVHGIFQARVAISFSDVTLGFPNSVSKMLLFLVCFYFSAEGE